MNYSKKTFCILVSSIIILGSLSCSSPTSELEEHKELLSVFFTTFSDLDHPVFYKTISKEKVTDYLQDGFSVKNVSFLEHGTDSLSMYFGEEICTSIVQKAQNYNQYILTEKDTFGNPVVKEEDIPEFVKNRTTIPPPFNYQGFTNVNFVSTPIITQNRGIILLHSFRGDVKIGKGVKIYFFIKNVKDGSWNLVDSGAV